MPEWLNTWTEVRDLLLAFPLAVLVIVWGGLAARHWN